MGLNPQTLRVCTCPLGHLRPVTGLWDGLVQSFTLWERSFVPFNTWKSLEDYLLSAVQVP